MGRQILTKRAGADDDVADADVEDITSLYKNVEGVVTRPTKQQADGCFNSLFSNSLNFPIHRRTSFPPWPFTASPLKAPLSFSSVPSHQLPSCNKFPLSFFLLPSFLSFIHPIPSFSYFSNRILSLLSASFM